MTSPDELTPETPHHHKWWMSGIARVFRCNCGATLTSEQTILDALNLKEARIEELVREKRRLQGRLDAASLWAVKAAVVLANEFQSLLRGEEER